MKQKSAVHPVTRRRDDFYNNRPFNYDGANMMPLATVCYNVILFFGILFSAPFWLAYLAMTPKARHGFWQKVGMYPPVLLDRLQASAATDRKKLWLHTVSVGEFNAVRPLIDLLAVQEDVEIVVSTTTLTAQNLAAKTYPDRCVFYFPYDVLPAVKKILNLIQPDLVVITETEIWPNFIDQTTRVLGRPLVLINGRISPRSFKGYKNIKPIIKPTLREVTHFYTQSQADADRLRVLGDLPPERLTVAGNLKFDLNPTVDPIKCNILAHLFNLSEKDTVLTFASIHSGEDEALINVYLKLKQNFPELKAFFAPRHPERREELSKKLSAQGLSYSLRSNLTEENLNPFDIVVLDSIGELITIYSFSTVAVMGGSFVDRGGQNPLEPISQKVPVLFGPHMENFSAISQMILDANAGYQAGKPEDLVNQITQLLTQPEQRQTMAHNGLELFERNQGTKEILATAILQILNH